MRKSRFRDIHYCSLPTNMMDDLYPIPPNAGFYTKFCRAIRGWCIMDPTQVLCKDFFRNKSTMLKEQKRYARSPYRFVIHPFSKMNRIFRMLFYIAWMLEYYTVSLVYVFPHKYAISFHLMMVIVNLCQLIVFISFFFVGYVIEKERKIVIEHKKIVCHYLRTYFFFDLEVVFSKWLFWLFLDKRRLLFGRYAYNASAALVALVACFTRYKCGIAALKNITRSIYSSKILYKLCYHITAFTFLIHLLTCSMFSIPKLVYGEIIPKASWMRESYDTDDFFDSKHMYFESLILVICFFFGASYDRYTFSQPTEQIVLAFISIIGRLYTLHMLADFLRVFGLVGVSESKYEQYLGQLEDYMLSKNLPNELRTRILKYYEYKLKKRYFNETQIFATLSETLKTELFLFGAKKLIEKAEILKSLPKTALGVLFASMKAETFVQMDIITTAGGKVDNVYFISSGTVAVIDSADIEVNHLEDGDEFGFLVTPDGRQLFTHVAVESSEIYYLRTEILLEFLRIYPEVFRYFENRIKKKIEKYTAVEQLVSRGGNDVVSSLRAGQILESQHKRHIRFDD